MALPVSAGRPEPLQLPDVHRLEQMPSLPAWVGLRIASLTTETQPDPSTGKWRPTVTLPSNLSLSPNERDLLLQHVGHLDQICRQTPAADDRWQQQTWAVVTKMMLVMPSVTQNEISAEARGEAYLMVLEDIPFWAALAAVRRWYRGECGTNEAGEPYDYHWAPAPAELRRVAKSELYRIEHRVRQLRLVLNAEPRVEYDEEHCRMMRVRLGKLFRSLGSSPVGKDGSGGVAGGSFPPVDGAHCGTQPRHSPA